MHIHQILGIILILITCSSSRGPHHPRGESIIKHHVHYKPIKKPEGQQEKITQDEDFLHDIQHIKEELDYWVPQKVIDQMTDDELEFHFFNIHDSDRNSQLDGLEILQAMRHLVDHDKENENEPYLSEDDFNYFVEMTDIVLLEDDTNCDGYLSYAEYVAAKKKEVEDKAIDKLLLGPKIVT